MNKSTLVPFMRVYEVTLQNRCGTTYDFGNFSPPCFVFQLPWFCTKANSPHSRLSYDMRTCCPFLIYKDNLFEHVKDCEKYKKKIEIFKRAIFFLLFLYYRGKFRYVLNLSTVLHMIKSRFPVNKTINQPMHPHPCLICRTLSQTVSAVSWIVG